MASPLEPPPDPSGRLGQGAILSMVENDVGVHAIGEVDMSNWDDFSAGLARATGTDGDLRLDLSELSFIDVGGLRVLHESALRLAELGRRVVVLSPQPEIEEVMAILGLCDLDCILIERPPDKGAAP